RDPVNAKNSSNQYYQGAAGTMPSSMTGPPWGTGSAAGYNYAQALKDALGNANQNTTFVQGGPLRPQREAVATQPNAAIATPEELKALVAAALEHWQQLGVSAEQIAAAADVPVYLTHLPGNALGYGTPVGIVIDVDAAGHGWFTGLSGGPA